MHAYLITGKSKQDRLRKAQEIIAQKGISETIFIIAVNKITIEQIRDLKTKLSYSPSDSKKGRAVVVEEANFLTQEAANAFLKTLEEPAGKTMFILTAPNADQVTETLCSRCEIIDLGTISDKLDIEQDVKTLDQLLSIKVSQRLEYLDQIKDSESANHLCQQLLFAAHQRLIAKPSLKSLRLAISIEKARQDIAVNVNTKLALVDMFLNFSP